MAGDGIRKPDGARPPPRVAKDPAVRWLAADVADELHRGPVVADGERDRGSFGLGAHSLELGVRVEGLPATLVDDPGGSTDLRVRKRGDVLLQEVHEPALALEEREEGERAVGGRARERRS